MLLMIIASFENSQAAMYYSRTSARNWSDNTTWSTVNYRNSTNILMFPKTGDSTIMGDRYALVLNATRVTDYMIAGQGSSRIFGYPAVSNPSLTIRNNLFRNTNAKVWNNRNAIKTHSLIVGGNLTYNRIINLYGYRGHLCSFNLDGSLNGTQIGPETFDLNTLTLNKSTLASTYIDIQSNTFEVGIRNLVLTSRTYYHYNSFGVIVNDLVIVTNHLEFNNGVLYSTSYRAIKLANGALFIGASATSFADDPFLIELPSTSYTNLEFPIGKDGLYSPVNLQVQSASNRPAIYKADLTNNSSRDLGYTWPSVIARDSAVRYYTFEWTGFAGLKNPSIAVNYEDDDLVTEKIYLRVLGYNGSSAWGDLRGASSTNPSSSITSSNFNNFHSVYVAGNPAIKSNPLPATYLNFDLIKKSNRNLITIDNSQRDKYRPSRIAMKC